jgi:hypothetical protein
MTTRRRTTATGAFLLVAVALAGACSNSGRADPEAAACAPPVACPACPTGPAGAPAYEALFTSIVVTVSGGDVQTFQNMMMGRRSGKWYDLFVADQVAIDLAEPMENTKLTIGEKLLSIIKANPDNVGDVLADGATWSQRGRVAYSWEYGPFEGSEDDVLIVSTFRWLEGEPAPGAAASP